MPRTKRDQNENKSERFKRLASLRTNNIIKNVQLLGNLANTNNYEYDEKQISRIFGTIAKELRESKSKFDNRSTRLMKRKFSLD